jgi:hypothetical protein
VHVSSTRVVHALLAISIKHQVALSMLQYFSYLTRFRFQDSMHPFICLWLTRLDLDRAKLQQVVDRHSLRLLLDLILHLALLASMQLFWFIVIVYWPLELLTS